MRRRVVRRRRMQTRPIGHREPIRAGGGRLSHSIDTVQAVMRSTDALDLIELPLTANASHKPTLWREF